MAKRFRDTNLSKEKWFRKLSPIQKCFWSYICDECDAVGVFIIDEDRIEFDLGETVNINAFINAVNDGKERVRILDNNEKLFITGFVEFQYGELSENCKPHIRYIQLLKKHGLFDTVCKDYPKGIDTLEEKEEEKDKEKDKEGRGSRGNRKSVRKPNFIPEVSTEAKEAKADYAVVLAEIQKVDDSIFQRQQIASFIQDKKPTIIEPYMDLWNLSAPINGLSRVETISDSRLKKFNTRVKEPSFDFIKILTEIKASSYLRGKTNSWKCDWDWVFENDSNYIKIIEQKYRQM